MAQALGTGKGGVNVDLNIVPFIDVMSCLTAFLLVTAVWISTAQLKNSPAGKGGDNWDTIRPKLSVLIEYDELTVTLTPSGEVRRAPGHDWAFLEHALKELRPAGDENTQVEIAAESTPVHPVPYQALIAAMDTSVRAGFPDVGVTDPARLAR
jgi:biopolymer transport protein ExbD